MNNHLFDQLFQAANSKSICLETEAGTQLSYAQLKSATGQAANALQALGVSPGDRVAAQVSKCVDTVILYLACVRCGAVFLPLNTAYTAAEVEYFINDAEPRLFICDSKSQDELQAIAKNAGATLLTLDGPGLGSWPECVKGADPDFVTVAREPADLAAILYTSGTTGRAKGAMLSHENLASNATVLVDCWQMAADDVLLHALPIFHTHGLFVAINVMMFAGAKMLLLARFQVAQIMTLMPNATVMMGVPTFYTRLLGQADFGAEHVKDMRLFISGSAPLLFDTHSEFQQRTGHAILERYGMTETNMICSNPYDGERRAGTVGHALAGVDVRICDAESGEVLPAEHIGVIEVKGPNVFKGYWRMDANTREAFRDDGYFITGDLGKFDEQGYLHILGRNKDLIISGGFNIYPKEIELEIDDLEGVIESAVIGLPHPDFGEAVTAVVVRNKGSSLPETEIMMALEKKLARFKQPKRIFFVEALPRNAMGKVQKNLLREQYSEIYA